MKTALAAAALAVCLGAMAAPAVAAPYKLDRLHDRETRIQDAVDQRRASTRVGDALIRIRKEEEAMRDRHGSNLTRRDFAILNARLDRLEGVGAHHRVRRHRQVRKIHHRRGATTITTTTTTVEHR